MRRRSATRWRSPRHSRCSSTDTSTPCTATRSDASGRISPTRSPPRPLRALSTDAVATTPAVRTPGPWLLGIAANLLRRHWRTERRRLDAYARSAGAEAGGDLAPPVAAELATALLGLPRREREPLLLLAWADLSYEEIGV